MWRKSCWSGLEVELPAVRRTFFPSTVLKILRSRPDACSCQESPTGSHLWTLTGRDDDKIFPKAVSGSTTRNTSSWDKIITCMSISPACLHCILLEHSLGWTVFREYGANLFVVTSAYCLLNKHLYKLNICYTNAYISNSVWTRIVSNSSLF